MTKYEILTLITSGLAIFISGVSLKYSSNSNKRSFKIQELQSRPWLIATIHKNDTSGRFYDIIQEDGRIYWAVEIEIENKGATPANNIRIPQIVKLKDIKTTDTDLALHLENIVLGQGQKYLYQFKLGGQPKNPEDLQKLLNQYQNNDKGVVLNFKVFYTGLIKQEIEYKSEYIFDIKSDKFSILNKSEYK